MRDFSFAWQAVSENRFKKAVAEHAFLNSMKLSVCNEIDGSRMLMNGYRNVKRWV